MNDAENKHYAAIVMICNPWDLNSHNACPNKYKSFLGTYVYQSVGPLPPTLHYQRRISSVYLINLPMRINCGVLRGLSQEVRVETLKESDRVETLTEGSLYSDKRH